MVNRGRLVLGVSGSRISQKLGDVDVVELLVSRPETADEHHEHAQHEG